MAYHNRGTAHYLLGNKRQAKQDWERAGKLYQKQGDQVNYEKAMNDIKNFN
jgi:hypothetical protein